MSKVIGTSLAAGLVPSVLAAKSFYKGGNVALRSVPAISAGATVGALLGSTVALYLTDEQLRGIFGGGMLFLGLRTLIKAL